MFIDNIRVLVSPDGPIRDATGAYSSFLRAELIPRPRLDPVGVSVMNAGRRTQCGSVVLKCCSFRRAAFPVPPSHYRCPHGNLIKASWE